MCVNAQQKNQFNKQNNMKKIAVIVNKNWETEPVLNALTNPELKPQELPFAKPINTPKDSKNKMSDPRAVITFDNSNLKDKDGNIPPSLEVVIYCIQDLMYLDMQPAPELQSTSSSSEKDRVLKKLFTEKLTDIDLVIAVGTAGYPFEGFPMAGSVVIGSEFFIKNGNSSNPKSYFKSELIGKIIESNVNAELFHPAKGIFNNTFRNLTESKFIPVPNHKAEKMVCIASPVYCAISFVNVTEYSEYGWADQEAIDEYYEITKRTPNTKDSIHRSPVGSIETTHGIIRVNSKSPTIFISAITDNLGYFNSEVTPTQNYTASFNSGLVLGQLLCSLNEKVKSNFDFNIQKK